MKTLRDWSYMLNGLAAATIAEHFHPLREAWWVVALACFLAAIILGCIFETRKTVRV